MWCVDGQVERGSTNLVSLRVYSRPVEVAFLLHFSLSAICHCISAEFTCTDYSLLNMTCFKLMHACCLSLN